jgi:hypothetical protein
MVDLVREIGGKRILVSLGEMEERCAAKIMKYEWLIQRDGRLS